MICDVAVCDRPVLARGMCQAHYARWSRSGDPGTTAVRPPMPIEDRFWSKVEKTDGCWLWTGYVDPDGYGHFTDESGRRRLAHRWACEHFVGPIPDGYQVDHVVENGCVHRHCVNFEQHLEPVTPRENTLRGDGPAAHRARQTECKHGHPFDDENTYRWRGMRFCRACNRRNQQKASFK